MSQPIIIRSDQNAFKLYTPDRFLGKSDRIITSRIGHIDNLAKSAIEITKQSCPGLEAQMKALKDLDTATAEYQKLIDDMSPEVRQDDPHKNHPRLKVPYNAPIYKQVTQTRDNLIYYKQLLKSEVQDCINTVYNTNDTDGSLLPPRSSSLSSAMTSHPGVSNEQMASVFLKIKRAKKIRPCGFRSFKDYAGGESFEEFFEDYTVAPFKLKNYGDEVKGLAGSVLYGPSGTGKSTLAEAVAQKVEYLGSSFYSLSAAMIKSKWSGDSELIIQTLFDEARKDTRGGRCPVVVFFDEVDSILNEGHGAAGKGILAQVNTEMEGTDGTDINKGLIVILATNDPTSLPDSINSRFPNKIPVLLPTRNEHREYLVKKFTALGETRYNLHFQGDDNIQIDNEPLSEAETKAGKKVPSKRIIPFATLKELHEKHVQGFENLNRYHFDALDVVCEVLEDMRYSPRDLDMILRECLTIGFKRSREFSRLPVPVGCYAEPGQFVEYQEWILDKTSFITNIKDGKGGCTKSVEEFKHILIPLGPHKLENKVIHVDTEEYYGTLGRKVNGKFPKTATTPGKQKERWGIVTHRKLIKEKEGDVGHWEYRIVAQEKETATGAELAWINPKDHTDGELIDNQQLNAILGPAQISVKMLEDVINMIKPNPVNHARQLFEYAAKRSRPMKRGYSGERALLILNLIALEEQEAEEKGIKPGTSNLLELSKIVKSRMEGKKDFTFDSWIESHDDHSVEGELNSRLSSLNTHGDQDQANLESRLNNLRV